LNAQRGAVFYVPYSKIKFTAAGELGLLKVNEAKRKEL
jgi:hypothetical protein